MGDLPMTPSTPTVTPQVQPQAVAIEPNTLATSHTGSGGQAVPRGLDLNRSFEDKKRVRANPVPEIVMLDPVTDVGGTGSLVLPVAPSVPVHMPNGNANGDIAVHTAPPVCMPSRGVNADIAVHPGPAHFVVVF